MENVKKNNLNILQQKYKDLCRSVNWIPTKKEPKYPIIEENEEEVDVSQLQALITTKIEEFGGSGHIDTLLECSLTMFRHTGTKPSEMTKIIKDILVKNTDIYLEKEPTTMKGVYWLTDKERERRKSSMRKWKKLKIGESVYYNFERKNDSLREILFGAITKMGPITLNKLSDISKVNWEFPFSNMNILSLRDLVNLILVTDPVFEEDVGNPTLWTISKKHKKNISKFANTNLKLPSKDDFYMSPLDDVYLCKCGVKLEGSMDTWKKGPSGEFLCTNCCETKVVVEEGTKTESPSEDNPWIQCDKCGSWIIASSDGIHDLSIYDDSNPNHLDYYCPKCREKDGLDAPHLNFDDDEDDDEEKDEVPVNTKVKQETHSRHDSNDSDMDEFEEKVEVKEKPTKRVTRKRRKSYSEDN